MASVRAIKRARSISKSGINCTSATRFNSASILQPCDFAFFLIVCSLLRDAGSATSLSSDFETVFTNSTFLEIPIRFLGLKKFSERIQSLQVVPSRNSYVMMTTFVLLEFAHRNY